MANAYIEEFADLQCILLGQQIQAGFQPSLAVQKVAFTTAASSAAFNAKTNYVRIHVDGIASYRFGDAATGQDATTGYPRMISGQTEYFAVRPGGFVSFIANT